MKRAQVTLNEGTKVTIITGNHTFITDEPADSGGLDLGPTPMDLLVGSLGACVAVTVRLYATRKGWPLEGVDVDVEMERYKATDYAGYEGPDDFVHEFKLRIAFRGNLSEDQRARLLEIAGKCPVHRAIAHQVYVVDELVAAESV
ncbi:MAG TPA: OsmC family protein [Candidatus Limnocylindrales bacterium]|nr:OsmC family protein [Candidatus Limnocylindrales bacterium]